jgi:hypothetical protein
MKAIRVPVTKTTATMSSRVQSDRQYKVYSTRLRDNIDMSNVFISERTQTAVLVHLEKRRGVRSRLTNHVNPKSGKVEQAQKPDRVKWIRTLTYIPLAVLDALPKGSKLIQHSRHWELITGKG